MAFTDDGIQKLHIILRDLSSSLNNKNNNTNNTSNAENISDESVEYIDANYPGILDTNLTTFTTGQRVGFIITITTLFLLSICGNIGTLYVNMRRKIRPFFRACLISLAISDLLSTVFLTMAYLSQITADYVQIWRLGPDLCGAVPFITTAAILASSITLVGIALDRYFAVMKAVIGFWNPGVIFCIVCMFVIWATAIGIASPVFWIFSVLPVYILSAEDVVTTDATPGKVTLTPPHLGPVALPKLLPAAWEKDGFSAEQRTTYTMVQEQQLVMMCVTQQNHVGLYYAIVFVIIFIPSIVAFIWLNSIIAKKVWIRRHTVTHAKRQVKDVGCSKQQLNKSSKNQCSKTTSNNIKLNNTNEKIPTTPNALIAQVCSCQAGNSQSSTVPSSIAMTMGGGPLQKTTQHPQETPVPDTLAVAPGKPTPNPPCTASTNTCSTRESRHVRMFTIIVLLMAVFLFFRLPAWIFLIMRMYGSYTKTSHWMIYFSLGILNLSSCVLNPVFYTFLAETIQYVMIVKAKVCDNWCGLRPWSRRTKAKINTTLNSESSSMKSWSRWIRGCCCKCCVLAEEKVNLADGIAMEVPSVQKPPQSLPSKDDKDEGVECSEDSDSFQGCYNEYNQQNYAIYPLALVSSSIGSD